MLRRIRIFFQKWGARRKEAVARKQKILGLEQRAAKLEKLREELAFASSDDLVRQIKNDINLAKKHFGKDPFK